MSWYVMLCYVMLCNLMSITFFFILPKPYLCETCLQTNISLFDCKKILKNHIIKLCHFTFKICTLLLLFFFTFYFCNSLHIYSSPTQ